MRHLRMVALVQVLTLSGLAHAQSDRPVLAVDSTHLDTTCAPCRDFYQFANGGWEDRATIPAQYSYFGTPREVEDRNEVLLRKILIDAARNATRTDDATTGLVGTFFGSCMDSTLAARQGSAPLQPLLGRIAGIRNRGDLAGVIGELVREGIDAGVPFFPYADLAHSDTLRLNSWQGSYGLPDRDFYLRSDSALAASRKNYRAHLTRMFRLLGDTPARARQSGDRVWSIELALARGAVPSEQAYKFPELHHPATRAALDSLARHVEWTRLFTGLGVPGLKQLNVMIPSELTTFDSLVGASPLEEWQAYLRWRAAHFAGKYLDARFEREQLAYDRIVSGQSQLKPRWQRCLAATDQQIGEALGRAYVQAAFTPGAKARMLDMIANLRTVMHGRIERLTWMSDSTRRIALAKLESMTSKIGYPDKWRDYSRLTVGSGSFLPNVLAATRFETDRQLARADGLVDRAQWDMTPPTFNAYFNPSNDEIVFPAGILQPPLFDATADDAVNYGAIGAVIGHEMLHAFDDNGRHFNARGDLSEWWTSTDSAAFGKRADVVVAQYGGYVAIDTMHVNGRLTLGENLADIGGLMVAYDAWELARRKQPTTGPIGGFTPEQRFFISFANSWRVKTRPEARRMYTLSDPHSPERWRTNGTVSQVEAFAKAFGCKAGDPMVQRATGRLELW